VGDVSGTVPLFTALYCVYSGVPMESRCQGTETVSAKVDDGMQSFLRREAKRLGVSRSEVVRRVFDTYRAGREGELSCPGCGEDLNLSV
jgi:hypothetical protein